ncbi:hypothetical protein ACWDZ8_02450 [Streptomyces sp. NPDC003233]
MPEPGSAQGEATVPDTDSHTDVVPGAGEAPTGGAADGDAKSEHTEAVETVDTLDGERVVETVGAEDAECGVDGEHEVDAEGAECAVDGEVGEVGEVGEDAEAALVSAERQDPEASAEPPAHEPVHTLPDVTVQLAPVGPGKTSPGSATKAPSAGGEGGDGPVFVDASGRRGRRFRRLGMAVAVACAGYAAVIAATLLSGNSTAPWLPVPGQGDDKPAGQRHTSPHPSASSAQSLSGPRAVTGTGVPASVGATAVPAAGSSSPAPGGSAAATPTAGASATATPSGPGDSPSASAPSTGTSPTASGPGSTAGPSASPTPTRRTPPGRARHSHPPLPL